MRVRVVRFPRPNVPQEIDLAEGATAEAAVRAVGAHPDMVLVVRAGTAIPLDAALSDEEELRLVTVSSGG